MYNLKHGKAPQLALASVPRVLSEETSDMRRQLIPSLVPTRRVLTRPGNWKVLLIPQV